ncbi:hypothetical protein [Paraburkholderia sp. BCC1886]|uniref:hypothetical protein n=1 Tax=Paraburkholderia sp. BCC1886 TaxID=2562670 RepID=UPI001182A32B|nr:hypothetical protein [Paraburkholderia sp. BCC1886]
MKKVTLGTLKKLPRRDVTMIEQSAIRGHGKGIEKRWKIPRLYYSIIPDQDKNYRCKDNWLLFSGSGLINSENKRSCCDLISIARSSDEGPQAGSRRPATASRLV